MQMAVDISSIHELTISSKNKMNIISPNTTLDPCSQWIMENEATTFIGENTTDKELEWLRICIGPQRCSPALIHYINENNHNSD